MGEVGREDVDEGDSVERTNEGVNNFVFKQKTAYAIRLSLVGSEMCIGDTCRAVHPLARKSGAY